MMQVKYTTWMHKLKDRRDLLVETVLYIYRKGPGVIQQLMALFACGMWI